MFGEAPAPLARQSNAGRPRVPLRIMIALLYLKHAYNESNEGVVERWGETPPWQFFSGQAYFAHRSPCDASTLVKFRQLLGDEGVEELLAQTVNTAVALQMIQPEQLQHLIVDSTVQHKAIAHPTDSKLLETARTKQVDVAKQAGIGRKLLKRRQAIEPIIGHLKADHRMGRCHLKGAVGERLHAVLCAAGYNIRWLLRMIIKKGIPFLQGIFLCPRRANGWAAKLSVWLEKIRHTCAQPTANRLLLAWGE